MIKKQRSLEQQSVALQKLYDFNEKHGFIDGKDFQEFLRIHYGDMNASGTSEVIDGELAFKFIRACAIASAWNNGGGENMEVNAQMMNLIEDARAEFGDFGGPYPSENIMDYFEESREDHDFIWVKKREIKGDE